jgi:transposase
MNSVLSTINLPLEDKSVYCRRNGILPEELEEWEEELKNVLSASTVSAFEYSKIRKEKEELRRQLTSAEKELERKDKALAEAAALLLLQKMSRIYWGKRTKI